MSTSINEEASAAQDNLWAMMGKGKGTGGKAVTLPRVHAVPVTSARETVPSPGGGIPVVAVRVEDTPRVNPPKQAAPSPRGERVELVSPTPRLPASPPSLVIPSPSAQVSPASPVIGEQVQAGEHGNGEGDTSSLITPRPPRRSRSRKKRGDTFIRGTERDRLILDRLALVGMASSEIVAMLIADDPDARHERSVRAAEGRLYWLKDAGLVNRYQGVWDCPSVWSLTAKGTALSRFPAAPVRSRSNLPWSTATHELRIAELVGYIVQGALQAVVPALVPERSIPMTGRLIESAFNKRGFADLTSMGTLTEILDSPECLTVRSADHQRGGWAPKFPDLVLLRRSERPLAVEVELSIKPQAEYDSIMTDAYAGSGMDLLYLTATDGIAARVRAAAQRAGVDEADPDYQRSPGDADRTALTIMGADLSWVALNYDQQRIN